MSRTFQKIKFKMYRVLNGSGEVIDTEVDVFVISDHPTLLEEREINSLQVVSQVYLMLAGRTEGGSGEARTGLKHQRRVRAIGDRPSSCAYRRTGHVGHRCQMLCLPCSSSSLRLHRSRD